MVTLAGCTGGAGACRREILSGWSQPGWGAKPDFHFASRYGWEVILVRGVHGYEATSKHVKVASGENIWADALYETHTLSVRFCFYGTELIESFVGSKIPPLWSLNLCCLIPCVFPVATSEDLNTVLDVVMFPQFFNHARQCYRNISMSKF